ncbi:MAG: hypothetical protein AAF657_14440 [Acidobacteriota bacterium]
MRKAPSVLFDNVSLIEGQWTTPRAGVEVAPFVRNEGGLSQQQVDAQTGLLPGGQ